MTAATIEREASSQTERPSADAVLRLAWGTQLLGRFQGSGLADERFLLRRPDGQVVLVTPLLYQVASQIDARRNLDAVADAVTVAGGRRISTDQLETLVTTKLKPLGLVTLAGEAPVRPARNDPFLALSGRRVLIPARGVRKLANFFAPLFFPPVVVAWLTAFVLVDVWLFASGELKAAVLQVMGDPGSVLALFALVSVSMLFHEIGHAAACRYGGGKPGAIGMGIYLVFLAFYTNVTDAYRLSRGGRLRTDLGGVYFNAVFVAVIGVVGVATKAPLVLVLMFTVSFEMILQLVPLVRFDGYFILCDLTGVPDLFSRVRPTLRGVLSLGRGSGAAADLQPRARRIATLWVLLVVPLLCLGFAVVLLNLPEMVSHVVTSLRALGAELRAAVDSRNVAAAALTLIWLVLTPLPLLGMALLGARAARRTAARLRHGRGPRRTAAPGRTTAATSSTTQPPEVPVPANPNASSNGAHHHTWAPPTSTAVALTEEAMLRHRSRPPERGWRRILYEASGGRLNVGPSRVEQERRQLVARVKAPVSGSRRVVVLCRKGGAGKTTTTLMLGHAFATSRGDRVVALDANPDAGSLAHRVRRETSQTVTSMLVDLGTLDRYADIRAYTSQAPTRLEVIASDDDPRISQRLGEQEYHQAIGLLDRHYNLILVDTGTGILDAGIQGVLMEADQIVVVMPPALDGARVAAATLDWLEEHGHGALVQTAVAVINATRKQAFVELDRIEEHFGQRCAAVVRIPWDPALAAGATTLLDDLRPATQLAYLELAAAVADQFRTTSPRE